METYRQNGNEAQLAQWSPPETVDETITDGKLTMHVQLAQKELLFFLTERRDIRVQCGVDFGNSGVEGHGLSMRA